ncbi:hypothetical protein L9F63_010736, partial [Diploptera punctata]
PNPYRILSIPGILVTGTGTMVVSDYQMLIGQLLKISYYICVVSNALSLPTV